MSRRLGLVVAASALVLSGCTGYVWGSNSVGQLGLGTAGGSQGTPIAEPTDSTWLVLEAGRAHTCGVRANETMWCWGWNVSGQLGNGEHGSGEQEPAPVQVGAGNQWKTVAPGNYHTCAIDTTGRLWCWGLNSSGQLGDGTTTRRTTPTQVGTATDWESVTLMSRSTCGIRAGGTLWCWGQNSSGQLGLGDTTARDEPEQVAGTWTQVDGGLLHACAVDTTADLHCWGRNTEGQLSLDSAADPTPTPTPVSTLVLDALQGASQFGELSWVEVSAGSGHTCAIFDLPAFEDEIGSNIACTGSNTYGQTGLEPPAELGVLVALAPPAPLHLTQVSAGGSHTCAIHGGVEALCWGRNASKQLGDNSTDDSHEPGVVGLPGDAPPGDWSSISAGTEHTVGIRIES